MPSQPSQNQNPESSIGPSGITWSNEKRKLKDLKDWPKNPRKITDKQAAQLAKSIVKFGYIEPIQINLDGTILGGHMRKRILLVAGIAKGDTVVDVRVPSRLLTEEEVEEVNIRLNRNTGEWDFDALANEFDEDKLIDWGFEAPDFGVDEEKPHSMGDANQGEFCSKCKRPF